MEPTMALAYLDADTAELQGLTLLTVLSVEGKQSRDRREPRLLRIESESIRNLIALQDDLGYEKYIRLNKEVFSRLERRFSFIFEHVPLHPNTATGTTRLARRALSSKETLFVLLRLLAGSAPMPDLAVLSGVSVGTLSRVLRVALVTLLVTLRQWRLARISVPTVEEAASLASRISNRLPYLRYFIGFADGEIKALENPSDYAFQESNYNGYYRVAATKARISSGSSAHCCMQDLYLFLSDGCIAAATVNGVGTWHDSRFEFLLDIDGLLHHLPPEYLIAVDTAFPGSARKIRGLSETELGTFSLQDQAKARTAHEYLAKLRVAAEWGIGGTPTEGIGLM